MDRPVHTDSPVGDDSFVHGDADAVRDSGAQIAEALGTTTSEAAGGTVSEMADDDDEDDLGLDIVFEREMPLN